MIDSGLELKGKPGRCGGGLFYIPALPQPVVCRLLCQALGTGGRWCLPQWSNHLGGRNSCPPDHHQNDYPCIPIERWRLCRDSNFLKVLGIEHLQDQLKDYWPNSGLQWDALFYLPGKNSPIYIQNWTGNIWLKKYWKWWGMADCDHVTEFAATAILPGTCLWVH